MPPLLVELIRWRATHHQCRKQNVGVKNNAHKTPSWSLATHFGTHATDGLINHRLHHFG